MDTITRFALGALIGPSVYYLAFYAVRGVLLVLRRSAKALAGLRTYGRGQRFQGAALSRRQLLKHLLRAGTRRIQHKVSRFVL